MRDPGVFVDQEDTVFSAVLLAGGRSTRMGFDKSSLLIKGEPLWQRQIHLLQSLGAVEVSISGPAHGPWQGRGIPIIEDTIPFLGPMGALVGILEKSTTDHVLILAVDMPAMHAGFLRILLAAQRPIVPIHDGYFEPLAAIYHKKLLPSLRSHLANDQRSLQRFLRECVAQEQIQTYHLHPAELICFENLNTPPPDHPRS